MEREVWSLRSRRSYRVIEKAFRGGRERFGFRLNEYSVQGNHIHIIAEANDADALARGVKGLSIRIARGLNRLMARRGRVIADRWHQHILRTPTEVRRALAYVLNNFRKHQAEWGIAGNGGVVVDRFSSASADAPIVRARTWLLNQAQRR
jgi:REP element-mobilizing transposase RayT